jgi:Flp pilus assembly protein TadD
MFVPRAGMSAAIAALPAPRQLVALRKAARAQDPQARILYGVALAQLGHRVSAARVMRSAARLAPDDPEALTAAAVLRFDKDSPSLAFRELGPLTTRFPRSATVRFHLGLMLIWLRQLKEARTQLTKVVAYEPRSRHAEQARKLLAQLPRAP